MAGCQGGVYFGGLEAFVAKKQLQGSGIDAALDAVGAEAVAQEVQVYPVGDACFCGGTFERLGYFDVGFFRFGIDEEVAGFGVFPDVEFDLAVDRNDSFFVPFAPGDHVPVGEVNLFGFEIEEFGFSEAAVIPDEEHGAIFAFGVANEHDHVTTAGNNRQGCFGLTGGIAFDFEMQWECHVYFRQCHPGAHGGDVVEFVLDTLFADRFTAF